MAAGRVPASSAIQRSSAGPSDASAAVDSRPITAQNAARTSSNGPASSQSVVKSENVVKQEETIPPSGPSVVPQNAGNVTDNGAEQIKLRARQRTGEMFEQLAILQEATAASMTASSRISSKTSQENSELQDDKVTELERRRDALKVEIINENKRVKLVIDRLRELYFDLSYIADMKKPAN